MNSVIAECDADGGVEWVWVMAENARHPRPFDPARDAITTLGKFKAYGAPRRSIVNWLTRMQDARTASATA